ncbi:hypothetical protein OSCI_840012 [Kamptonema sp. PCC 6506]|nr:hypothetical protein OSCI_840012 [Kamptonema sp. PCC 6506]
MLHLLPLIGSKYKSIVKNLKIFIFVANQLNEFLFVLIVRLKYFLDGH